MATAPGLIDAAKTAPTFPTTRYQGSKRKLAGAIASQLATLDFSTVLDAFGGTGAVAHTLKRGGKQVTYNDVLAFNHQLGIALIENDTVRLTDEAVRAIGVQRTDRCYGDFIQRTFDGIYFTQEENGWLDVAVANVHAMGDRYERALAWFALFQACMAKRPYNLFHRCNLYMRTADVQRGFGNKASWDRGFDVHVRAFASEANRGVAPGRLPCRAICGDALEIEPSFDLVYIDTPYINGRGVGVDYRDFYHFLEGMVRSSDWPGMVDYESKHRRLERIADPWSSADRCHEMFRRLFDHFRGCTLAVSYRSDGVPSVDELASMLRDVKRRVRVIQLDRHQYVLSTRRATREVLLLGTD